MSICLRMDFCFEESVWIMYSMLAAAILCVCWLTYLLTYLGYLGPTKDILIRTEVTHEGWKQTCRSSWLFCGSRTMGVVGTGGGVLGLGVCQQSGWRQVGIWSPEIADNNCKVQMFSERKGEVGLPQDWNRKSALWWKWLRWKSFSSQCQLSPLSQSIWASLWNPNHYHLIGENLVSSI